jgi:hypothetical protein
VRQKVSVIFATDQAPAPPSWGFGTPVTWNAAAIMALDYSRPLGSSIVAGLL